MLLIKLSFQTNKQKNCKTRNHFHKTIFMNTRKSLKIYNVGYTFKVQTVFKTNKHNNVEYFDQIILIQTRKLKLINFQARVSITYVTIFTQGKRNYQEGRDFHKLIPLKTILRYKKKKKKKARF